MEAPAVLNPMETWTEAISSLGWRGGGSHARQAKRRRLERHQRELQKPTSLAQAFPRLTNQAAQETNQVGATLRHALLPMDDIGFEFAAMLVR